jgi:hypothetical protein
MFESGLGTLAALSLLGPVALIGVIALCITAIAGGRDPDPTGQRQKAVYLGAACFVAVVVMLFAGFAAVNSLAGLVGEQQNQSVSFSTSDSLSTGSGSFSSADEPAVFQGEDDPNNTEHAINGAVLAGLFFVAAGVVFIWHRRQLDEIVAAPGFVVGPARRAVQAYVYALCFVAALIALVAGAIAIYGVFRVLAPDVTAPHADHERDAGFRQFLSSGVLAGASVLLLLQQYRRPDDWRAQADLMPPAPPPPPRRPRRRPDSEVDPGPVA